MHWSQRTAWSATSKIESEKLPGRAVPEAFVRLTEIFQQFWHFAGKDVELWQGMCYTVLYSCAEGSPLHRRTKRKDFFYEDRSGRRR